MGSQEECVRQIDKSVALLRQLVRGCSTISVTSQCLTFHLLKGNGGDLESRLSSPAKQLSFLLGILLESTESTNPKELSKAGWEQAEHIASSHIPYHSFLALAGRDARRGLDVASERAGTVAVDSGAVLIVREVRRDHYLHRNSS